MKPGAPWSIKGIEPEAREAAKAKAREAGMTLGQWLNQAIADAGQPRTSDTPQAQADSSSNALETARIMRAIAEVARRVDVVAASGNEPGGPQQAALERVEARLDELAKAIPAESPGFDQARIERGLVAIARRIDQVEKSIGSREMIETLRAEVANQPAPSINTDAFDASVNGLASQIESLGSRLDGIEQRLSEPDQPQDSEQANQKTLDQLSQDVRKLMNGMVNLAAKVDAVADDVDNRLQPLRTEISGLDDRSAERSRQEREAIESRIEEASRRTPSSEAETGALQAAVAAAIGPLAASVAELQNRIKTADEREKRSEVVGHDLAEAGNTEAADHREAATQEIDRQAEAAPAADDQPEDDVTPSDDGSLSGLASLHDLTRADDIQVRPYDDEESFFKEIETDDETVADPDVSDDVTEAVDETIADPEPEQEASAEPSTPHPSDTEPEPVATDASAIRATIPEAVDHIPEDANPPDRPRRLVPVESLLAGPAGAAGGAARANSTSGERAEPSFAPAPHPAPYEEDEMRAPKSDAERKPFRLDEPLDLSRQAPAAPPSGYPGRRRWLGYLLVAIFFLVFFVGGFWFTGTPQFRDVASEAGKLWDQAVASINGADLGGDIDASPTASNQPQPTAPSPAPETSSAPAPAPTTEAPAAPQVSDAPAVTTTPDSEQAALQPSTEAPTPAPAPEPTPAPAAAPSTPQTPPSDLEILQARANDGDADAQFALGVRHRDGIGVEPNYSTAADWFDRAAQQGHVPAQLGLGIMYRQGLGRPRDLDLAKLWLHAAARAGDPDAQKLLGEVYVDESAGVPDYFQAARWFREAAQQGVVDAQYNMGVLYEGGLGVPRDFAQAYYWFSLAANAGDRSAPEDRERNAQLLTPEQRAELDAEVAAFRGAAAPAPTTSPSSGETAGDTAAILQQRDEIRVLQQLLISRGYDPGSPDGIPGAKTRQAVQAWQEDQGLAADGRVTRAVLESLKAGG